jgi:hypothetical protein
VLDFKFGNNTLFMATMSMTASDILNNVAIFLQVMLSTCVTKVPMHCCRIRWCDAHTWVCRRCSVRLGASKGQKEQMNMVVDISCFRKRSCFLESINFQFFSPKGGAFSFEVTFFNTSCDPKQGREILQHQLCPKY